MGVFQAEQLALCGQLYRRSHRRRQPATDGTEGFRAIPKEQSFYTQKRAIFKPKRTIFYSQTRHKLKNLINWMN